MLWVWVANLEQVFAGLDQVGGDAGLDDFGGFWVWGVKMLVFWYHHCPNSSHTGCMMVA